MINTQKNISLPLNLIIYPDNTYKFSLIKYSTYSTQLVAVEYFI